jgi:NADPH:quinone reductase-like Zn-dependent oxidoreductase
MKAIVFNKFGGPEVLEYVDMPVPVPGEGQLLIKVQAASVNPVDWKIRRGNLKFITGKKFPLQLGAEISGVVEKTGPGVSRFVVGQRVFAGLSYKGGGYAEYAVVPESNAILIPDNIPFDVASTFAVAGMTPLQAFRTHAKLEEGSRVLINGASGGLGTYAVQIAKIMGLHVTAVCSSRNAELVKSLGADEIIDYEKESFKTRINAFDCVLDSANNSSFGECKKCLKKNGMFIKLNFSIGILFTQFFSNITPGRKAIMLLMKNSRQDLEWMRDHIAVGQIKVVIDRTYPLEKARDAHEYSETGRARGKIVLIP